MKKIRVFSFLVNTGLLLSACSSIQYPLVGKAEIKLINTVQVSLPAFTITKTLNPTSTIVPLPSSTPRTISTATPEALVILYGIPGKYLPTKKDCNRNDGYYLPKNGYSPTPNEEIFVIMGIRPGRKYVNETGRVTGWEVEFLNEINKSKPARILAEAEMYELPAGAQKALEEYNPPLIHPEEDWQTVPSDFRVSENQTVYLRKDNPGTAAEFWHYLVEFTYHNYRMKILAEGSLAQMDMTFLERLVKVSMVRLKQEKLYALDPAPIPTQQPGDSRLIDAKPQDLVLVESDLPKEANYNVNLFSELHFSPSYAELLKSLIDDESVYNFEIFQDWGIKPGREYVINTGRDFGWDVSYFSYQYRYNWYQNDISVIKGIAPKFASETFPRVINSQVVRFDSIEGAREGLTDVLEKDYSIRNGWKILPGYENIGDASIMSVIRNSGTGQVGVYYSLSFVYKNFMATVSTIGNEPSTKPALVKDLAKIVLQKMMVAPLVEP